MCTVNDSTNVLEKKNEIKMIMFINKPRTELHVSIEQ